MLNNSNKFVKSTHRMCHLTHEFFRNRTSSRNGLHTRMEKLVQELGCPGICDMKDLKNNVYQKDNLLGKKANDFTCETTVNDHLIERKEFNLDGFLNHEPIIGQETLDPPSNVNCFFN